MFEIKLQILLIDEEVEQLLPLVEALHRAGLAATVATSGDEAVYDVEASPPDLVVLDADMTEQGVLSRLRAVIPTLPIVVVSDASKDAPRLAAMLGNAGVSYIEKPVDVRVLLQQVSEARLCPKPLVIDRSARTRANREHRWR